MTQETETQESQDFGQILAEFEDKGSEEQQPPQQKAAPEIGDKVKGRILSYRRGRRRSSTSAASPRE